MSNEDYSYADTVEFTIEAEVIATYRDTDRIRIRWHSGEETILPSDTRLIDDE
mgnify:CR=1 FL=1